MGRIITLDSAEAYNFHVEKPLDIEITWEPSDLSTKQKKRIHSIATLAEKPDLILGQRSSMSFIDDMSVQIKGHIFKEGEDSIDIYPPRMIIFIGYGHPDMQLYGTEDGDIVAKTLQDVPRGPLLEELALQELEQMRDMSKQGLPIVKPYGLGLIKGMEFCIKDSLRQAPSIYSEFRMEDGDYENEAYISKRHKVYCLIINVKNSKRALVTLTEMMRDMDTSDQRQLLEDFFGAYGRTMAYFFDYRRMLGNPHIDNVSIEEATSALEAPHRLRRFSQYELLMHDPGLNGEKGFKKEHFTQPQWEAYVLCDITNALEILKYLHCGKAYFSEVKQQYPDRIPLFNRLEHLADIVHKIDYSPNEAFFIGLLGEERRRLPSDFATNWDIVDVTSQIRGLLQLSCRAPVQIFETLTYNNPLVYVIRGRFG